MNQFSIYLGTVGWQHDHWKGSFYPDGMPDEWQLSFYNTQFRCVYLIYEAWASADDATVENWLADTQDGFRFVLQVPSIVSEPVLRLAERFGQHGIREDKANLLWLEGGLDLRDLAHRIQDAYRKEASLFMVSRDAELVQLSQVRELMQVLGV